MTSVYEAYADILGDDLAAQPRAPAYVECTDECKQRRAEWEAALAAYASKWPNYCRVCGGAGGFEYEDDPGDRHCSLPGGTMTFSEPCTRCLTQGVCPRCGKLAWPDETYEFDLDEIVCPHCGWREDEPDAAPVEPECWCWEEHLP